jgi:hypothetical protein
LERGDKNAALKIALSRRHTETFTDCTVSPWVFFEKALAVKAPRDLYTLAMSQVSYKERTKTTIVFKNCILKLDTQEF